MAPEHACSPPVPPQFPASDEPNIPYLTSILFRNVFLSHAVNYFLTNHFLLRGAAEKRKKDGMDMLRISLWRSGNEAEYG